MTQAPVRLVGGDRAPEPMRFNFTKRELDRIKPASRQTWVYDTAVKGLCMIVTPAGARTFYLAKRMEGRYRRVKIGTFPEVSIEQARKSALRKINAEADGKNPAEERRQARDSMTFGELFEAYMVRHAKVKKRESSWREDQRQYDKHLKRWAGRRLDSLTSVDVERLHTKMGSDHPYAANRLLALVSAVFSFAKKPSMGWKGDNPAKGIDRFAEQTRRRWLDSDELPHFIEAVEAETDNTFRDYFRMLLFTGARRENVASMRWDEIDMRRKVWTIPHDKFKGNRPIEIPLVPQAMAILTERSKAQDQARKKRAKKGDTSADPRDEYVFPSKRRKSVKPHMYEPKIAFARVCERAGITSLRVHDLRRTVDSWAMRSGVPDPVRKGGMMGHAIPKGDMDGVYAMFGANIVRESFEKTVNAMLAAKGGE